MDGPMIGHNLGDLTIEVEVRLFNSLTPFGGRDGHRRLLSLPAGSTIDDGDVVALSGPVPYSWGYGSPVV